MQYDTGYRYVIPATKERRGGESSGNVREGGRLDWRGRLEWRGEE